MGLGTSHDLCNRRIPYTSCRIIDDAFQCFLIGWVYRQPEIGYDIFDFLTLVKRLTAIYTVRDIPFTQCFLEYTRLRIGAVKYGEIGVIGGRRDTHRCNTVGYEIALLKIGIGAHDGDFRSYGIVRKYMLGYLLFVLGDKAVCRRNDSLGRAVILFELEDSEIGIFLLQIENIADIGPPERIDALGIVSHDTEPVMRFHQLIDDKMLGKIGILILIDQNIPELILIKLQHIGVVSEKDIGIKQQIIEIHRPSTGTTTPINLIYVAYQRTLRSHIGFDQGCICRISRRGNKCIFGIGNNRLHGSRLIDLIIERHLFDDGLDKTTRIGLVVNREITRKAYSFGIGPQYTGKYRVESTHPQARSRCTTYDRSDAFFHFTSSLIGKSQRENLIR